jgi:hypothetical protein
LLLTSFATSVVVFITHVVRKFLVPDRTWPKTVSYGGNLDFVK